MKTKASLMALLVAGTFLAAPALAKNIATEDASDQTAPRAETTAPLASATADMKAVLDAQASLKPKPIESLDAAEARLQPTPADGARIVARQKGLDPADPMGVATRNITVDGAAGAIPARVYTPEGAASALPVVLYFHGGGFVIATNDTYDATPRAIAKLANAVVVSVEYRKAPEAKFPAAHDDAFAAYQWLLKNNAAVGGNGKVALLGESAGGNLAINTAIRARDAGIRQPLAEVLVYPVAGADMTTLSYVKYANAKPLNKPMMTWFVKNYLNNMGEAMDPRIDINGHGNVKGLPPTTIINAEIDPLQSDGQALAKKLQAAGVPVETRVFPGVTHEFFGMGAVVEQAKNAELMAAESLKTAFAK